MLITNSSGQTIAAEWVVGPTIMGARVVIKVQSAEAGAAAAFFDGCEALTCTDEAGNETVIEGYSVLVAMTRKDAQDGWLVSLARP